MTEVTVTIPEGKYCEDWDGNFSCQIMQETNRCGITKNGRDELEIDDYGVVKHPGCPGLKVKDNPCGCLMCSAVETALV